MSHVENPHKDGQIFLAGKLLGNGLCLCGVKVKGQVAEVSVRTRDAALAQSFMNDSARMIQRHS